MTKSSLFAALPLVLVASAALANDSKMNADATPNSDAVEMLKSTLTNTQGFKVEDMRTGDEGVACITYSVTNEQRGESRIRAVVQGDKVLRESNGNARFEKAWNSKCAGN